MGFGSCLVLLADSVAELTVDVTDGSMLDAEEVLAEGTVGAVECGVDGDQGFARLGSTEEPHSVMLQPKKAPVAALSFLSETCSVQLPTGSSSLQGSEYGNVDLVLSYQCFNDMNCQPTNPFGSSSYRRGAARMLFTP